MLRKRSFQEPQSCEERGVRRTKTLRKGPVRFQKISRSQKEEEESFSDNPEESLHELTREDLERFVQKRYNRRRITDSILRLESRIDGIEALCLKDEARLFRQGSVPKSSSVSEKVGVK